MPVELILSRGSNSGTAAPIHPGYYLVGRHQKCQIRPKSRSVSRRHCLLVRNDDGLGAIDLKSTRGTFVNGTRLAPHRWRVLADGDLIRFGTVAFKVVIGQPAPATLGAPLPMPTESSDVDPEGIPTPSSWQNNDIAAFLADGDAAEAACRDGFACDGVTAMSRKHVPDIASTTNPLFPSPASDIDFDEESETDASTLDTLVGERPDDAGTEIDKTVDIDSAPIRRPPNRRIDPKEYKRAPKRSLSLPGLPSFAGSGADWKLIGSVALVVAVIGLFTFQVYSFQKGPQVQVRQDLD